MVRPGFRLRRFSPVFELDLVLALVVNDGIAWLPRGAEANGASERFVQ